MKKKLLISGYFFVIVGLFLYSYTQVDLSLTFSRASIFQTIEKGFQYIGYFNRPLSTYLFCIIVGLMFIFYGLFLKAAKDKKITLQFFWKMIIPIGIFLAFTYNAFSYDLFNYIFYTKIILHYHQNPYLVKALDFPKDPMLSFMHWTHNTYPYGPLFLILTVPLAFLGFNYFLPTFFLFKLFSAFCFLATTYFISKILKKIAPEYQTVGTIFYALNPLVLIESLVSAHNDVVMMLLAVLGVYLLLEKKWIFGVIVVALSALTKQATEFFILPAVMLLVNSIFKRQVISQRIFLLVSAIVMVLSYIAVATQIEIQPWYTLWFLPFVIFLKPSKYILWFVVGYCLGVLLRYVPYLWQGDWNGTATLIKLWVTILTPIIFLAVGFIWEQVHKRYANA